MEATAQTQVPLDEHNSTRERYVDRLPPYFPTSCKQCEGPTDRFFKCFEKHAVMKDSTDVVSAKESLRYCQPQLREYKECMEKNMQNKKSWWRKLF
ncbi:hypothetical protein AGDE_06250 [Angomonas deanei]|uniref:Uncharacterized protein n=1 Tax=Angomonas deanei TaxID=59799 RepID=S9V9J7_9TRYP|nr:hypothetical protein AGDE_08334 [Angomonas deanei]EPY37684.1 hypothetical protein AGDE_06250 [Angomonas deanei]CAD2217346.1 hypothetical protein, conserved [Angomonas deanei]|eukprot:EPY33137.1 hypothetical protein AGDE_08334 [Angomonas deanei]